MRNLLSYFNARRAMLIYFVLTVLIIRLLGFLAALYSIYLIYTGLPTLMKSLPEKSVVYTVVVVVAAGAWVVS